MIVDASALVAVLTKEPDAARYLEAMAGGGVVVPTPTLVEASLVLARGGPALRLGLDRLLSMVEARLLPFSAAHAERAVQAHAVFGRGSGHPAGLNYGDCMVYGVASVEGEALLFKGDDFSHTDLESALASTS